MTPVETPVPAVDWWTQELTWAAVSRTVTFDRRLDTVLRTNVSVQIVRQDRRGRCVNCQHRRELYRVSLTAGDQPTTTEARCAPCWGIR